MPAPRKDEGTVAMRDVYEYVDSLEKYWHVSIHIEIWPIRKEGFWGQFDVMVVAKRASVGSNFVFEQGTSGRWPTHEASTMSGLYLRLLLQLDHKLEERARDEESKRGQARLF